MSKRDIEICLLREVLTCDALSGVLFWKHRPVEFFKQGRQTALHNSKTWNGRFAGKEAFTSINAHGYKQGHVFGVHFTAHRVIWAMSKGCWPENDIDHINGDRSDNRIENMRAVTRQENLKNTKRRCDNASGVIGVYQRKDTGRWCSYVNSNGKRINLGCFNNKTDAIAVRKAAETEHGFHSNHGRGA